MILSCIQFVFLDLHLQGAGNIENFKTINSKLIGIFRELNSHIKKNSVKIFVNSKYLDKYKRIGIEDLEEKLKKEFQQKY